MRSLADILPTPVKKHFSTDGPHVRGLVIVYTIGVVLHLIPAVRPALFILTPLTLFVCGAWVILRILVAGQRRFFFWLIGCYAFTFAAEAAGVATGKVFGPYEYGRVLGPMVLDVPLVIGLNWVLIVLGVTSFCTSLVKKYLPKKTVTRIMLFLVPGFAGLVIVLFDFIMEPAAIELGYWEWFWDGIPPQNYAAWFAIAVVTAAWYVLFKVTINTRLPVIYVLIQFVFFILLRLFL